MIAQQPKVQPTAARSRVIKLILVTISLIAAGLAVSVPVASAQTVSGVPRACPNGGVIVLDTVLGGVRCAVAADAPTPGQTSRCPAGSSTAADLGFDEVNLIGDGADFIEGACYYDTSCPSGYTAQGIAAQGPGFVSQYCVPSDPTYRAVWDEQNCVAADGVAAQWFPDVKQCGVVATPRVLEAGVSTPAQDCNAAGASFNSATSVCTYPVYSNSLPPEPTIDPTGPQPTAIPFGTPTPIIDPPRPTPTPIVIVDPPAPTATPVATNVAVPTPTPGTPLATATATVAPVTPTPTPTHPGFGFTG